MEAKVRNDLFWHLTPLRNMENILKEGLLSRKKLIDSKKDVIQDPFAEKRKNLGLNEYVPFHFLVWNPLDISLLTENAKRVHKEAYCFITIEQDTAKKLKSKIIFEYPNHKENLNEYLLEYNDKYQLPIDKRRRNTDYSDGKQKLQTLGELLVKDHVDSKCFYSLIVETDNIKMELESKIKFYSLKCRVDVEYGYFHPEKIK
jgi:hypothetical protein